MFKDGIDMTKLKIFGKDAYVVDGTIKIVPNKANRVSTWVAYGLIATGMLLLTTKALIRDTLGGPTTF